MQRYNLLVLTDHRTQTADNSIFGLLEALRRHPHCGGIDVASRGIPANDRFFQQHRGRTLHATRVDGGFSFHPDGRAYRQGLRRVSLGNYDLILSRLPHPVTPEFWAFLGCQFQEHFIINRPCGIQESSSKAFLLNFPDVCPPMARVRSVAEVSAFLRDTPLVLKPLRNYGGHGIIRMDPERTWLGDEILPTAEALQRLDDHEMDYLAMAYLTNVDQGDKRVLVVNGQVLGAVLRVPRPGAWLCNASRGGQAVAAEADADELAIAHRITPLLRELGILMFGFDTLVNGEGRRVLSEINTMSIGGMVQIAALSGRPILDQAAEQFWQYVNEAMYDRSSRAA